eukprot:CAMPEP_0181211946 /NCGR_PEP_ID=MMETSP1096-20121128/24073_1 /TAXON_ID=156174 ORGANISM="Chrysochromulina ericina, Strain CCMP281" /NCGR_SAMPLE_ID=MMETSP1096 /ASSEMBLY_ACC=CAM_ASM_000453 /LENGTH=147 /DNA_ID=CAMNT_0023303413 /DNA_START=1 /DNA_END=444 /DNA_ORIENTATION=-
MAPTYLKWMLLFEDPNSRTLTLAKALPRDWLAVGQPPVVVRNATSRYGRLSYSLHATSHTSARSKFTVAANVTLPPTFGSTLNAPPGGVQLRMRAPVQHAGKLVSVQVGGKPWTAFDATAETINFAAELLSPTLIREMQSIVATWSH